MYNKKISVIVPVYNVEKYLRRCINSIINQSYGNLEIILVNDGSLDSSGRLCDEIAMTDDRILVIHKENGGQSSARNIGLNTANGDYIAFVDSDDWIMTDMYQHLVSLLENNDADIADIGVFNTNEEIEYFNSKVNITVLEGKSIVRDYLYVGTISGSYSACRKLYKSKCLGEVRFEEGIINEDIIFNYLVLLQANKLVKSTYVGYIYFQGGRSTTRGCLKTKDFDLIAVSKRLMELTSTESYRDISFLGKVKYARAFFSLLSKIAFFGVSKTVNEKEVVKELTRNIRKNIGVIMKSPMPLNRKFMACLLCLNINLLRVPLYFYKLMFYRKQ